MAPSRGESPALVPRAPVKARAAMIQIYCGGLGCGSFFFFF
jgi:hypothetical protein